MNYLEPDQFLINKIRRGEPAETPLQQVAGKLIGFYSARRSGKEVLEYGRPEAVRKNVEENLLQTKRFVGSVLDKQALEAISLYSERFQETREDLFQKRVREERIVDGHGDLQLEHIHISNSRICIYDCIEFNNRFRFLDVAADLAFLAMELDFNQLSRQSEAFVKRMVTDLDDPDLKQIIDFYKCYRACVRGKVKGIESLDSDVSTEGKKQAAETASRYYRLALRYSLLGSIPTVLIFMGPVAGGKSTLARDVAARIGAPVYSSDIIRKKLAGIPAETRLPEPKREKLYRPDMSRRTYQALLEHASETIENGNNVIVDATFSRSDMREKWIGTLKRNKIPFLFVEVSAPDPVRRTRLVERNRMEGVVSDARAEEMQILDSIYQPLKTSETGRLVRADTTLPPDETVRMLFQRMVEFHLSGRRAG